MKRSMFIKTDIQLLWPRRSVAGSRRLGTDGTDGYRAGPGHGGENGPRLLPGAITDYIIGFLAAFGSLIALKRRAHYGGIYLVRVSLCQTGMWLRSLDLAEKDVLNGIEVPTGDEIKSFSISNDTGFGPMSFLRPPVQLSATPAHWKRGVVPLGPQEPVWPANP